MSDGPSFTCRMYEEKYPEVDEVVMVQVKSIAEMGAYVSLLEYNNIDGMILLSELSRRRIRSVNKLIKVGRQEPVMVLRVDTEKGYIDLSKRRVSPEDAQACEEKFNKSKLVHTIMRHAAETTNSDLEETYKHFTWPLYKKFGHAHDAFKVMVTSPEDLFKEALSISGEEGEKTLTPELRAAIIKDIKRRMTPTPLKIRADIELTCFQYDGVLHIKDAIGAGEAISTKDCTVKIKLLAPPLYVLTTQTIDRKMGIEMLSKAIEAVKSSIESNKGKLVVREGARAVSERDEKLLKEQMARLESMNRDVGDSDEDDYEDGMGDIDVENAAPALQM
mmetsp:Transcript_5089/g.12783  ORF Transcript_5089/g.12783 Transcript_5089/m.12783 type:complete len:333 (+) Transcript_5089:210-1208(+)